MGAIVESPVGLASEDGARCRRDGVAGRIVVGINTQVGVKLAVEEGAVGWGRPRGAIQVPGDVGPGDEQMPAAGLELRQGIAFGGAEGVGQALARRPDDDLVIGQGDGPIGDGDGARLWVNGRRIVDSWILRGATDHSGTIALNANQKYDLVLEYFENAVTASAQLSWSSDNQPKQIIPSTQLYPAEGPFWPGSNPTVALVNGTNYVMDLVGTCAVLSATNVLGPWAPVATNNIAGPYITNTSGADPQMFFLLQNQ